MQFKQIAFFTILSLLLFSGCNQKDGEEEKKQEDAKTYRLTTTKAQTLHIKVIDDGLVFEEFKQKVVLVYFFTSWCKPCKAEIPHLNNLREKYKNNFEIIAILLEKGKTSQDLKDFIKKYNIKYPITNSNENYILAKVLGGIKSIPTMFMYNKNGKLIEKYVGIIPQEMMEIDIKKALK